MSTIVITDAEQRAALAAVRSLGAAGHRVIVCSSHPRPLAGSSRYAAATQQTPDPLGDPGLYIEKLADVVHRWDAALLLPIAEASLIPVLAHRGRFAPAVIPFPTLDQFSSLSDKAGLMERAPQLGIAVPRQRRLEGRGDPVEDEIGFPLVAKPARSIVRKGMVASKLSVRHIEDGRALKEVLSELPAEAYPVLLQQRIVGPGIGIFLLRWNGETLAAMAHRRIREKPPSGGVSVFRETIPAPAELVTRSEQLLDAYNWSGVAMVEYKLDASTAVPYLMEVNGRLWGSLQLAIDAGVDFPTLLVAAALGEVVQPVKQYKLVRSRWWWGDVDHLIARWRSRGPIDTHLPSRLRTTLDVLAPWHRRCQEEVFRWDDPRPFLRETGDWFHALAD